MRKVLYTISATAVILGGLVACNNDEGAMDNRGNNARPIGYYSNENNDHANRDGNAYTMDDNDGPLTEMMDRTGNNRNGRNNAGIMGNRKNGNDDADILENRNNGRNATPYNDGNPNTLDTNDQSTDDMNYHGHLNDNNAGVRDSGYYSNYDGKLARDISEKAAKVANVDDARTIVTEDNILVAVDTSDRNDKNVESAVRKAVEPLAKGKNINVVTDEGTFTRVRDIDNDIRNGNRRDTIDTDIDNLFKNIGNTIRQPFTNNNR